jgi:hypothetical protein
MAKPVQSNKAESNMQIIFFILFSVLSKIHYILLLYLIKLSLSRRKGKFAQIEDIIDGDLYVKNKKPTVFTVGFVAERKRFELLLGY